MGTFTETDVRSRAQAFTSRQTLRKSASIILNEASKSQTTIKSYDIFLSHSFRDAELILGIKLKLEQEYGCSVYVDWIEDPQLDRTKVTRETAEQLRTRMNCCGSLFYATTPASTDSKWMPWECGFFDGRKNRAAILPVTAASADTYNGQEYLGIYPYITEDKPTNGLNKILWVNRSPEVYCNFKEWLAGKEPFLHSGS